MATMKMGVREFPITIYCRIYSGINLGTPVRTWFGVDSQIIQPSPINPR